MSGLKEIRYKLGASPLCKPNCAIIELSEPGDCYLTVAECCDEETAKLICNLLNQNNPENPIEVKK